MIFATMLIALGLTPVAAPTASRPGTVYVVLAVDTETRELATSDSIPELNLHDFDDTGQVGRIMADSARNAFPDSYGHSPRFTWFVLTHEAYLGGGARGSAVFTALERFSDTIATRHDLIGWHYHNCDWEPAPSGGAWRQLTTFSGRHYKHGTDVGLAEQMLATLVVEDGYYPAVFRSGWDWEDNDFSNWLDSIAPFDFSNAAPLRRTIGSARGEALMHGCYDWSRAPSNWMPYHPSRYNYQQPGHLHRTIFQCLPGYRGVDLRFEDAFRRADQGENVVVAAYTHSFSDLARFCRVVAMSINNARMIYPGIRFKYADAVEAARAALGLTDTIPPSVTTVRQGTRLTVIVNKPLFAPPFGAVRTVEGDYRRLRPRSARPDISSGDYRWTFDLEGIAYDRFAVAGVDPAGNTFVAGPFYPQPISDLSQNSDATGP